MMKMHTKNQLNVPKVKECTNDSKITMKKPNEVMYKMKGCNKMMDEIFSDT